MKINNLYISLIVVIFSLNITADGGNGKVNCYSKDPELGDSAAWAAQAIEFFSQNKFTESIEVVDSCFNIFASDAVIMQKELNAKKVKYPPSGRVSRREKEKIHDNWAVNDVSVALWSKARSLEEMGNIDLAKIAYSQCIFLTHGRAWDPKGWFWVPASDCVERGQKLVN